MGDEDRIVRLETALDDLRARVLELESRTRPALRVVRADEQHEIRVRPSIAPLLAGASRRARAIDVLYVHHDICERLKEGLETLGYALNLAGAISVEDSKRHVGRLAAVIGDESARLEKMGR